MLGPIVLFATWTTMMLLSAAAMARAAKSLGSDRGRFGVGIVAAILIYAVGVVAYLIALPIDPVDHATALAIAAGLVLAQLLAALAVLRRLFRLPIKRAFGPLGAYVAVGACMIGVALFGVRPYVAEAYVMPTQSMSPALEPGDRFFVNKLASPRRWDVVAYWNVDTRNGPNPPVVFAKRLVGLPGERLRFEGRTLYVNDEAVTAPHSFTGRYVTPPPTGTRSIQLYREGQTVELGADEYFLVGDALDISADSRHYSPTPGHNLIGVVESRYWPPSRIALLR